VLFGISGALLGIMGVVAQLIIFRQPKTTPVMRGYIVAQQMGCFACHGPDGLGGVKNPGAWEGEVPPLAGGGALMAHVRHEGEIRDWILYGAPRRLWSGGRKPGRDEARPGSGLLRMPAYASVLSEQDLEALLAYLTHLMRFERPGTPEAAAGSQVAQRLGCFGCHGPGGRGGFSNPGSFKGYIPPWDGEDFEELVRDDRELAEWILDGRIARFQSSALVRHFTDGQVVQMPAYRGLLQEGELSRLIAYMHWLRGGQPSQRGLAWLDPAAQPRASRVMRGHWLYHRSGCVTCHGPEGRGGVLNPNAAGGAVPPVNDLAEKLELFEPADIRAVIAVLERGGRLEDLLQDPPVSRFEAVLSRYRAMRDLILNGSPPQWRDVRGPAPPLLMPAWSQRLGADESPGSEQDIDAILAYLLTLQTGEASR
jgi:mono/diheme cytochrome c family protein